MKLPSGRNVNNYTPIYTGSNFTWGEVTKNGQRPLQDLIIKGRLILVSMDIEQKIIDTAVKLDGVRALLGDRPLHVNSWYRPAHINKRVGGSEWSRHQFGDAVDIRSDYFKPIQIYSKLRDIHQGGLGKYWSFVHIDWRGELARWGG